MYKINALPNLNVWNIFVIDLRYFDNCDFN